MLGTNGARIMRALAVCSCLSLFAGGAARGAGVPCAGVDSVRGASSAQTDTAASTAAPLHLVQTIAMPGVKGRIDHLAIDLARMRLFVAALGNNTLEALDLRAGKKLASIRGLSEPQGVAYVPDLDLLFVTNGGTGTCDVIDSSLAIARTVKVGPDADNIRYDEASGRIYVGYGEGALAGIDAATGKRLADIGLGGHPESFQLVRRGRDAFVNVPSAGLVVVVDRMEGTITATWPLAGAESNYPMALDQAGRRLFVGCRKPPRLLAYDTAFGKFVQSYEIAGDADDIFHDDSLGRLYVICGAGVVNTFSLDESGGLAALPALTIAPGARTGLFVPELDLLYVAVPRRGTEDAEIRIYRTD